MATFEIVDESEMPRPPRTKKPATPVHVGEEPCGKCSGTGLVYAGFKHRATCPECKGEKFLDYRTG